MRLDGLAPDHAGVGWLLLPRALCLILALVDVSTLLAEVPGGLPPALHSLDLDEGLVLVLVAQTLPVPCEHRTAV